MRCKEHKNGFKMTECQTQISLSVWGSKTYQTLVFFHHVFSDSVKFCTKTRVFPVFWPAQARTVHTINYRLMFGDGRFYPNVNGKATPSCFFTSLDLWISRECCLETLQMQVSSPSDVPKQTVQCLNSSAVVTKAAHDSLQQQQVFHCWLCGSRP